MSLASGAIVGRYRIEALVGAGGMGEVYRARDTRLDRIVAIKVLGHRGANSRALERFEREAMATARLIHPNICRLYDVGREGDVSFLVMEYLEGETLAKRISRETIPLDEALSIAGDIARAVEAAHRVGLVHRDLKPGNVMLTAQGVKLLDFGLVRFVDVAVDSAAHTATTSALTGDGAVIGTVQYMSPEQVHGKTADGRSDVFALGIILYELLCGESPFARSSSVAAIAAIAAEQPVPLQERRPTVPVSISKIVDQCLQKNPQFRWPDAASLADALDGERDASRRRAIVTPRPPRPPSSHAPIRRIAVVPVRNISADADQNYLADGVTEMLMSALLEIRGLEVLSRTSANRFAEAGADVAALVARSAVDAFLEGSIARSGDRLRVVVRLVNARTNAHLWAATYDHGWGDWFAIGTEIAANVAGEIQLKISSAERRRRPKGHAVVPAAHDAYVRGRFLRNQGSADALRLSFRHYTTALELDPRHVLAHVGLADWYLAAATTRLIPPFEAMRKAKQAALRALELEPHSAQAHSCLGRVATYEWDLDRAQRELVAALGSDPNIAEAHLWLGRLYTYTQRFDLAVEHNRVAQRLDPLSPLTHVHASATLYSMRRFDDAVAESLSALELNPTFANAIYLVGLNEYFRGNSDVGLDYLAQAHRVSPDHASPTAASAYVLGRLGRRAEAMSFIERLKDRATRAEVSPYDFAEAYVGIDENDLAIEHLERSLTLRSPELLGVASDPIFDPIRRDPRFTSMLRQIGLVA
jgi:serine/threonine-protein kinase